MVYMTINLAFTSGNDKKNIFDTLLSLLNRHYLKYNNQYPLTGLSELIPRFESTYKNFTDHSSESVVSVFNVIINNTVKKFLTVFTAEGFENAHFYFSFIMYIKFIIYLLKQANDKLTFREIEENFYGNLTSLKQKVMPDDFHSLLAFKDNFSSEIHRLVYNKNFRVYIGDLKIRYIFWDGNEDFRSLNDLSK